MSDAARSSASAVLARVRARLASGASSLRDWPHGVARLGVVLCVAAAVLAAASRLDAAFGVVDFRADQNASRGYLDRLYGDSSNVVGSRHVVEDARLWMPEDARYRIVVGRTKPNVRYDIRLAPDFLRYFLLPRRESEDAPWIFCFSCAPAALGGAFEVLSADDGVSFGRLRK